MVYIMHHCPREIMPEIFTCYFAILRVGAQLGLAQMITIEIKIPNRLVGLGK